MDNFTLKGSDGRLGNAHIILYRHCGAADISHPAEYQGPAGLYP